MRCPSPARRTLRRALPPLALVSILASLLLWALLPLDSPVRAAVRFNIDRWTYYMRGVGPGRDAWLSRNDDPHSNRPPYALDRASPGGDIGIAIRTGYGTRDRLRPQLEALGLVSKYWVPAAATDDGGADDTGGRSGPVAGNKKRNSAAKKKLEVKVFEESFVVVADFAPPEGERYDGIEVHDGLALTSARLSPRLVNHPRLVKYRNLVGAADEGYSQKALAFSAAFGWELGPEKFLAMVEIAYAKMPGRKWYVFIDDDTVLVQPSLRLLLGNLDPAKPIYIGQPVGDYKGRFTHGGAATILSAESMRLLLSPQAAPVLAAARVRSLSDYWGEKVLGDTLQQLGIYVDEGLAHHFDSGLPRTSRIAQDRFCAPLVSFRGLAAAADALNLGLARRGAPDVVRWGDLWHVFGLPAISAMKPGLALQGGDHVGVGAPGARPFRGVVSAQACWDKCRRLGGRQCLAWTWDEAASMCYTASWFIIGEKTDGLQSGLHVERVEELQSRCR